MSTAVEQGEAEASEDVGPGDLADGASADGAAGSGADAVEAPAGPARASLPDATAVGALLDGLFAEPVTVAQEPAPVLKGRDVHVVAAYVEADGAVRAVVFLDLVLGCALGAALAMVPPPKVQEALRTRAVPPDLADNTREILNIAASLFNDRDAHLKLREAQVAPEPVADDVVALLREHPYRSDIAVEVPGYGKGTMVVLLAGHS